MINGTPAEKVEYLLAQVERFSRGVRQWQYEPDIHFSEVHYAVLRLCEDDAFAEVFRRQLSEVNWYGSPGLTHLDLDNLPQLLDTFFATLITYLEIERGDVPDAGPGASGSGAER